MLTSYLTPRVTGPTQEESQCSSIAGGYQQTQAALAKVMARGSLSGPATTLSTGSASAGHKLSGWNFSFVLLLYSFFAFSFVLSLDPFLSIVLFFLFFLGIDGWQGMGRPSYTMRFP